MDTGIGKVVDALKAAGMYENSVIVFTTDNGGSGDPTLKVQSSNFPLRDAKESLYEGGVRGVGWVHSPFLCRRGLTNKKMMFITDWFTTLLSVAGLESLVPPNLDSFNLWSSISKNSGSPRKEIIFKKVLDDAQPAGEVEWLAALDAAIAERLARHPRCRRCSTMGPEELVPCPVPQ